jgi:hypothetical protein
MSVAETTLNARHDVWNTRFSNYLALKQRIKDVAATDRRQLQEAIAEQFDLVMATPAPSVADVTRKLVLLWEADLTTPGRDADEKRQVIADLHQLIEEGVTLFGAPPS